jgi:hypothetical protein
MTGSEKQIKWAEQIKADALNYFDANIELLSERAVQHNVSIFDKDIEALRLVKADFEKIFADPKAESAATIIDRRNFFSGENIQKLVDHTKKGL